MTVTTIITQSAIVRIEDDLSVAMHNIWDIAGIPADSISRSTHEHFCVTLLKDIDG